MKNKLTPEEELLRSTLNESQFTYQEADWKQIESAVAKKGFLANYSPFFKAAAAFVVLGAVMYVLNQRYETTEAAAEQVIEEKQTERLDSKTETAELNDNAAKEGTTTHDEEAAVEATVANSEAVDGDALKNNALQSSSFVEKKEAGEQIESEIKIDARNLKKSSSDVDGPTHNFVEIAELRIPETPCLNQDLEIYLDVKGSFTDKMFVSWKMNGKELLEKGRKIKVTLGQTGLNEISATIFQNEVSLSSESVQFKVEENIDLDFIAEDLRTPFNDKKVKLSIIETSEGNYVWYETKSSDNLVTGNKIEWDFSDDKRKNITVEYTSNGGCSQTKTKEVEMDIFFTPEVFPNAFTPYNGGDNEVFELVVLKQYEYRSYELVILDMNGNEVFKTINKEEGWNGQLNNSGEALSGKFSWFVKLQSIEGEQKIFKGKVEIH